MGNAPQVIILPWNSIPFGVVASPLVGQIHSVSVSTLVVISVRRGHGEGDGRRAA